MEIITGREALNVLQTGVSDKICQRECADHCNEQDSAEEQR